jgi:replicative DNA helicase
MSARPDSFRRDPKLDALRVPPQSIPAEQAVLGGLMLAPEAWFTADEVLTEVDFYRRDHRLIYRAISELARAAPPRPFDAVTLGEWFEAHGLADQIGGSGYLIELASSTPSAANLRAYAEIVRDKSLLRQVIEAGTEAVNDGFRPEGRSAVEVISAAGARLGNLMQAEPSDLEAMDPILRQMFENLRRRYDLDGALDGLSTGLRDLDRVLNGLKGGRVYFIASRPKMGKTTLALNIAEHVALRERKHVAVFSLEMPRDELAERLTCSVGRILHEHFRTGQMEDADWTAANQAIRALRDAPIRLSRPHNARAANLVAQIRRQHAKHPLGLVVIDYVQLIDTSGAENRTQGLGEVSRVIKLLAVDLDIPIVVLSQLSRQVESRTNKRPIPSDLRDSGAFEQDADAVIFLYRDEVYDKKSRDRGMTEIDVALQRNGPSDTVRVRTRLDICRFEDLGDWEPDPVADADESTARPGRGSRFKQRGRDAAAGRDQ